VANKRPPAKRPPTQRPSGGAAKPPSKAQQAAMEAQARQARTRRMLVITAAAVFVVVLVVIVAVASRSKDSKKPQAVTGAPDPNVTCTADTKFDPGSTHVSAPTYTVDPPAGGDHLDTPSAPGIYDIGKAPTDGHIVHSMEHGYIVIWQRPDVSDATRTKTENVYKNHPRDILLVERASLPAATPVVATAWHHRLLCSGADEFQLEQFVQQYNNQGPELIPHNVLPAGRNPKT
jgi:hypothetical protein